MHNFILVSFWFFYNDFILQLYKKGVVLMTDNDVLMCWVCGGGKRYETFDLFIFTEAL